MMESGAKRSVCPIRSKSPKFANKCFAFKKERAEPAADLPSGGFLAAHRDASVKDSDDAKMLSPPEELDQHYGKKRGVLWPR
ncbi:hypothetical protein HPB51_000605 [Rhipicephalus microplus]|uniref:Uncharacterized protein n=1 Tax=Rhipicephalus microplus TaxID=6941 RepID=A0A9J6EVP4_RHIMP|nr:hypothetical protein HPB51_000605 [Rhipicephalus microplus]